MQFLRQNTAVIITVGPFYDKSDGVTIEGALTITNERITLAADTDDNSAPTLVLDNVTGATSGTSNDLNYITGTDAGLMQLELSAANTNRVGRMTLTITDAANHVPVFHELFVLPQVIYDWLTAGAAPLSPTTAGRTLDVTATGAAGIDWGNVENPTTTVGLSGTTVKTATDVETDTADIQSRLPAALVSGRMDSNVQATAAALTFNLTGSITGNLSGSVGSVTGAVGSVAGAVASVTDVSNIVSGAITVSGGIASADVKKVNAVTILGDGSGTPFHV